MMHLLVVLGIAAAAPASAHPFGHGGTDLAAGLAHPLTGIDHVRAAVAVGVWASRLDVRAGWIVTTPEIEPFLPASVLILGALLAAAPRLPPAVIIVIAGLVALSHGLAHGNELPMPAARFGVLLATAAIAMSVKAMSVRLSGRAASVLGLVIAGGGLALAAA